MMTFCRKRDLQESQPQSYSSREVVGSLDPNSYSLVAIRANHFSMYLSSVPGDIINILKSKSPIRQERQLSDEIATCPLDFWQFRRMDKNMYTTGIPTICINGPSVLSTHPKYSYDIPKLLMIKSHILVKTTCICYSHECFFLRHLDIKSWSLYKADHYPLTSN